MMASPTRKPQPKAAAKAKAPSRAAARPVPPWEGRRQERWAPRPMAPLMHGVLQRKCACGTLAPGGATCGGCAGKSSPPIEAPRVSPPIQRRAAPAGEQAGQAPDSVHRVIAGSGRPLDPVVRTDMEVRFGRDFSHVRIHQGGTAERSAREVGALAYTVGSHVVFGAGQYRPETSSGRFTLAHELAHVGQQQGGSGPLAKQAVGGSGAIAVGRADDGAEREADRAAEAALRAPAAGLAVYLGRETAPVLRRLLVVNPADTIPLPPGRAGAPELLTNRVSRLIEDTCPGGRFTVNPGTGAVTPVGRFCESHPPLLPGVREADASRTPVGCGCICDIIADARTTTIAFHAGGPFAEPTSPVPAPNVIPGTSGHPSDVTVNIDPRFQGQYLINGNWTDVPFHLLFSHELCGHARPLMRGTQVAPGPAPPGGTPPHEVYSVGIERQIAAEHNPPLPRRPDDYGGAARERP